MFGENDKEGLLFGGAQLGLMSLHVMAWRYPS